MVSCVKLILALIILFILAYTGYAIGCHECNPITNSKCGSHGSLDVDSPVNCTECLNYSAE